jgi:hypothetical protein
MGIINRIRALFATMRNAIFSGDAELEVLRLAAIDLSGQLRREGPSQNATRSVWYFQQSWNDAQVGPMLDVNGLYTRDVNQALTLALQNFNIQASVPANIL